MTDASDRVLLVATQGLVVGWAEVKPCILSKLADGHTFDSAAVQSDQDLSPASTVHLPPPSEHRMTASQMREFVRSWIASLQSAPICIQRLCELLTQTGEADMNEKFFRQLERVLSSSPRVRGLVRRRSSDGSSAGELSNGAYTPSPNRRVLKRARIIRN